MTKGRGDHWQQWTHRAGHLPTPSPVEHIAVGTDVGAENAGNWPHYRCDFGGLGQMDATLSAIERDHRLIRVLFNNAGIYHACKDWLDVPPDQFDDTRSSTQPPLAGQRGSAEIEYGASKAAVINLAQSLGRRLGRYGIRVMLSRWVRSTQLWAHGCLSRRKMWRKPAPWAFRANQRKLPSVVDFPVSDAASFITCATIDVNGGR